MTELDCVRERILTDAFLTSVRRSGGKLLKAWATNEKPINLMKATAHISLPHTHPFLELAYVEKGEIVHFFDHKRDVLRKGDYLIVDDGMHHGYYAPERSEVSILNCLFLPGFIDRTLTGHRAFGSILSNYLVRFGNESPSLGVGKRIFHDHDGRVGMQLMSMMEENEACARGYMEILRLRLAEIIILTMRQVDAMKDDDGTPVASICRYIRAHYAEHVTLAKIEDVNYMAASSVSRLFKKETGMLFSEYLQSVRIEEACRLLANSDERIIDIAEKVGYTDLKFFGELFRRRMGMTPREYRNQNR